ncbi:MAG TPA: hypothetical protein VM711_06710, partial [Sphingomicrobium sp.]|nr:hypothetical protein [Sphingomicrobium sp.]
VAPVTNIFSFAITISPSYYQIAQQSILWVPRADLSGRSRKSVDLPRGPTIDDLCHLTQLRLRTTSLLSSTPQQLASF